MNGIAFPVSRKRSFLIRLRDGGIFGPDDADTPGYVFVGVGINLD
jgi:hypothetical protein